MFNFFKKVDGPKEEENEEFEVRLDKLKKMEKEGIVYKSNFKITHKTRALNTLDEKSFRAGEIVIKEPGEEISIAGRVMSKRDHGGLMFVDVQDEYGIVQIAFVSDVLGDKLDWLKEFLDIGDFIGVKGEAFITKRGTLAINTASFTLLNKTLRPLPSKHFGFEDTEARYRKRYIDLLLNKETKDRFVVRSKVVQILREWLLRNHFTEVVTRTLLPVAGGANAETFKTYHKYLKNEFNLRISNELDLKMAIAGGFDRVFEFAIDFRNEGIDASHLQEFQMLEFYSAYDDYKKGIEYTKELLGEVLQKIFGRKEFTYIGKSGKEYIFSFEKDIPTKTFKELLGEYDISLGLSFDELEQKAKACGLGEAEMKGKSYGTLLDLVYKKKIRPNLIEPIFITNYPRELLPLARVNDDDETLTDSFQLVMGTWEIVKGYSELVNPVQQKEAFVEQMKVRKDGDGEAMEFNKEFLTAMEHGLPPTFGFGMGIDRFVCLITNTKNLKESVLFPLLASEEYK